MESLRPVLRNLQQQLLRSQAGRQRANLHLLHLRTQPTFRTRPSINQQLRSFHFQNPRRALPKFRAQNPARSNRRWKSDDAKLDSIPDSQLSIGQRLKKLSREYGWAAVYVYFGLSLLDFPFCFAAVYLIGADTVGYYEHIVVEWAKGILQWPLGSQAAQHVGDAVDKVAEASGAEDGQRVLEEDYHGYKQAEKANSGSNASIWTQLALAYAIHKSFIFVRVPLTAAVTPKVVKTLRGWGWNIGRPTSKALKSSSKGSSKTGVNTKGSGVKPDD